MYTPIAPPARRDLLLILAILCAITPPAVRADIDPPAAASQPATTQHATTQPAEPTALEAIHADAKRLVSFVSTAWVEDFLSAAALLPDIAPRTLTYDKPNKKVYSAAEAAALPEEQRKSLPAQQRGADFYYYTKYGSPLAYCRALDVVSAAGFNFRPGLRIADFGYGSIGHLRLLASLGLHTVGIDVDPELRALYSDPGDTGQIAGRGDVLGSIRLVHGFYPGDEKIRESVGRGFDLFMSKNTLKRGYVHPERDADPRMLLQLGVDDATYLKTVFDALNPGGYFLIYNLCPAQSPPDQPYKPMADGRSPFARNAFAAAGFIVIEFDRTDHDAIREMGRRLEWDQGEGGMDLKNDLFVFYTIAHKPIESK